MSSEDNLLQPMKLDLYQPHETDAKAPLFIIMTLLVCSVRYKPGVLANCMPTFSLAAAHAHQNLILRKVEESKAAGPSCGLLVQNTSHIMTGAGCRQA